MFAVTGKRTTIVQELERLTGEPAQRIHPTGDGSLPDIPHASRYVLAAGVLRGLPMVHYSEGATIECLRVNLVNVLRICEAILETNRPVRICVVGSESAEHGSFDRLYAAAKAGVHAYVRTRAVAPCQQLVCVSPTIIEDSGMTERRHDYPEILNQRPTVRALDVARCIYELLWGGPPAWVGGALSPIITNQVFHVIRRFPP